MALSTSQLKQVVSARVTGVGATSTHVIGGTNTITNDVDIAFSFTLKCKVTASNSVVLRYHNQDQSNKIQARAILDALKQHDRINQKRHIKAFKSKTFEKDW